MAADDFVDEGYNVAVIENHNGDPYATDISDGRNAYYGISGYPTGFSTVCWLTWEAATHQRIPFVFSALRTASPDQNPHRAFHVWHQRRN
jgi:hypothetical protein